MLSHFTLTPFLLLFNGALAHYNFGILRVNDTRSETFQYVREVTPNATYNNGDEFGRNYPYYAQDIASTNFTCGRDAFKFAPQTETATVLAGTEVGFKVNPYLTIDPGKRYNNSIFHEGPGNIYMAKVPDDDVESFTGFDGDWFKVAEYLAENDTAWKLRSEFSEVNFTIPKTTPPGKYLARMEQLTFTPYTQFYVNCAHLNVVGPGGGTPGPFAKFPGTYDYYQIDKDAPKYGYIEKDLMKFKGIGPAVWSG